MTTKNEIILHAALSALSDPKLADRVADHLDADETDICGARDECERLIVEAPVEPEWEVQIKHMALVKHAEAMEDTVCH